MEFYIKGEIVTSIMNGIKSSSTYVSSAATPIENALKKGEK